MWKMAPNDDYRNDVNVNYSIFFEKYFSWQDNLRLEIRAPEEKKIVPIMDKSKKF